MYKLIIGNVRVSVLSDDIKRPEATDAAKRAIAAAQQSGKLLSLVEIAPGPEGLEVVTTEKSGNRSIRKTLRQSMLEGTLIAAKEKFYPSSAFSQKESWFDPDTGQEWSGREVEMARENILAELEQWIQSVK